MQKNPVIHQDDTSSISFKFLIKNLINHRELIAQMIYREVVGRYKGSIFGMAWSLFNPILMLVVYTFVFSVILKAKWGGVESQTLFAIVLFVGLIVLNLFNEVISRAPSLIISNVNFVKKVVFPIEILPVVTLGSALFHSMVSFVVLIVGFVFINGYVHWTCVFLPLVFLPLMLVSLGIAWMLAAFGVFIRDINQLVGVLTMMLMFLSPVFYPVSAIPYPFRTIILANPLTFMIEQARELVVWGHLPNWAGLCLYAFFSLIIFWLGFVVFQKTRKGFADVL